MEYDDKKKNTPLPEKARRCTYCGRWSWGENDGIILGPFTWVDITLDFSRDMPDEERAKLKEQWEHTKTLQKELNMKLDEIRSNLEDLGWTHGKYYGKVIKTIEYNRSILKTITGIIENKDFEGD